MTEQGVAVEADLGVEDAQVAVFHDDQRVYFQHRHVLLGEGFIEDREEFHAVGARGAFELEGVAEFRRISIRDAAVDRQGHDLLRRIVRNRLDVHAAFGRNDESHLAGFAINQDGEIEFAVNVGAVFDIEAVDLLAGGAGLRGHKMVTQHLLGVGEHVVLGEGEADTALFARFGLSELAFAAPTGVNLAFHDPKRSWQRVDRLLDVGEGENRYAFSDGGAKGFEHRFCLVFVNVHMECLDGCVVCGRAARRPANSAGCITGFFVPTTG